MNGKKTVDCEPTRDKLTFKTPNKDEADAWCEERRREGYIVSKDYDPDTGMYICTAIM